MVISKKHPLTRFIRIFLILYPILPVYFAVNISDNLPLLSMSRVLLLLLFFFTALNRKRLKSNLCGNLNRKQAKQLIKAISIYTVIQLIISFAHPTSTAINNILSLFLERVLLFYCLACWIDSKEKMQEAIKILVLTSGIVCLLAITEPFTETNLAYFLDTAGRSSVLKAGYYRNGMLRAEFTFGHPIELGLYTVLILPFSIYLAGQKKQFVYWCIVFLNILANIFSFSRSTITIMIAVCIVMVFLADYKTKVMIGKIICIAFVAGIVMLLIAGNLMDMIWSIFDATLAAFGLGTGVDQYNTIVVRTTQWSVLNDILKNNPILGAGIGYIQDNTVYYINSNGNRGIMQSIDCEYLEQIIEGGMLGIGGFIVLFGTLIKLGMCKKLKRNPLMRVFLVSFIGCLGCYISVSELKDSIIWTYISLFLALIIADGKDCLDEIR